MSSADGTHSLDEKGRVTIPKSIRERLRLEPGDAVSIGIEDGKIVIRRQVERENFIEKMQGCVSADNRSKMPGRQTLADLRDDWRSV